VAMQVSPNSLVERIEKVSAAGTTNTFPSSLVKNRFRPSETGDAVKPSPPRVRRSEKRMLPAFASKEVNNSGGSSFIHFPPFSAHLCRCSEHSCTHFDKLCRRSNHLCPRQPICARPSTTCADAS